MKLQNFFVRRDDVVPGLKVFVFILAAATQAHIHLGDLTFVGPRPFLRDDEAKRSETSVNVLRSSQDQNPSRIHEWKLNKLA